MAVAEDKRVKEDLDGVSIETLHAMLAFSLEVGDTHGANLISDHILYLVEKEHVRPN